MNSPCHTRSRHILLSAALALLLALAGPGVAHAEALHISPGGDDSAPGTHEAPVQTLRRLQRLLAEREGVTEVVFHDGVYYGSLTIPTPPHADPPPLLIRAADGASPVLDGAQPLPGDEAVPVDGAPGVYRWDAGRFRSEADRRRGAVPPIWDAAARVRFTAAADLRSVAAFPATYAFTDEALYLHTPDGLPPARHRIEVGRLDASGAGLIVQRADVTVRGLAARNYAVTMHSAGFLAAPSAERVAFEDCRVTNSGRGFRVRSDHARILRCRTDDVGSGILFNGEHALIEGNLLLRGPRDAFRLPMPDVQEDTGIEVYYPAAGEVVIRGNTVRGFSSRAVLFKCRPGDFHVERNTFIDNRTGVDYLQAPRSRVYMRHNVVVGSATAMNGPVHASRIAHRAYGNVVWPAPWAGAERLQRNVDYMNTVGEDNVLADPRLAASEADDFRLLPGSPALDRAGPGLHAGAWEEVPADFEDTHPPLLNLAHQPALDRIPQAPDPETEPMPRFAVARREFPLRLRAMDAAGAVAQAAIRIDGQPWGAPLPFAPDLPVRLPGETGDFTVCARVADEAGNWSDPVCIGVRAGAAEPRVLGTPTIRSNRHGAVISFRTDVHGQATGTATAGPGLERALLAAGSTQAGAAGPVTTDHVLGLLRAQDDPEGPWRFRIRLSTRHGEGEPVEGEFSFTGELREGFVSPSGADSETGGTRAVPWRTLQYGADRTLPGERLVILPGVYAERLHITRGGMEGAPLVVAAENAWDAVLDGRRRIDNLITVERASHVTFEGLELRWFGDTHGERAQWAPAIRLTHAPHVTVRRCRIWNDFWGGRLAGHGISATNSPGFVLEHSLLYRLDWAISMGASPGARLVFNTMRGFSHGGLNLRESVAGTVIRNNCFTYYGNYAYWLTVRDPADMDTFDADYNNIGTRIRHWRDEPGVVPNLPWSWGGSKTVGGYMRRDGTFIGGATRQPRAPWDGPTPDEDGWEGPPNQRFKFLPNAETPEEERGARFVFQDTFEDWQVFSGQDRHSIYADPRHVDIVGLDFRLQPDSPNIGAGEGGANIGAMPVAVPE